VLPASLSPGWRAFAAPTSFPKTWGLVKERLIAISLVLHGRSAAYFATVLVAFGSRIETRILFHIGHEFGPLILLLWGATRWTIAILTSIAVIQLIYQMRCRARNPGTPSCLERYWPRRCGCSPPHSSGGNLQHYADYSVIYGSLGVGIALLVWMYLISLVVLIGAELMPCFSTRTNESFNSTDGRVT